MSKKHTYAVIPWREDNHYSVRDAIKIFTSEKRAQRYADKLNDVSEKPNLVVRTVEYIHNY